MAVHTRRMGHNGLQAGGYALEGENIYVLLLVVLSETSSPRTRSWSSLGPRRYRGCCIQAAVPRQGSITCSPTSGYSCRQAINDMRSHYSHACLRTIDQPTLAGTKKLAPRRRPLYEMDELRMIESPPNATLYQEIRHVVVATASRWVPHVLLARYRPRVGSKQECPKVPRSNAAVIHQ